jgi:small subunit ribosomal protein S16
MALKIRLRRMGRKKSPHYRIVVAESSMPRDGRFVANLGHYNPTTEPTTLKVDVARTRDWLGKGAVPTDTVGSLLKKAGVYGDAPGEVFFVAPAGPLAAAAAASASATAASTAAEATAAEGVRERVKQAAASAAEVAGDVAERVRDVAENTVEAVREVAEAVVERVTGDEGEPAERADTAEA